MLNYLGPNFGGNGPITNQLPPATPGTMPASIPHTPSLPAPLPPMMHGGMGGHGGIHPRGLAAPPAALAAIMNRPGSGAISAPPPEYEAVTQSDGSILLHIKGHNGELGPVVKVLPAIKRNV